MLGMESVEKEQNYLSSGTKNLTRKRYLEIIKSLRVGSYGVAEELHEALKARLSKLLQVISPSL